MVDEANVPENVCSDVVLTLTHFNVPIVGYVVNAIASSA